MTLTQRVVKQIQEDVKSGDLTAIDELIDGLLEQDLEGYNLELLEGYLPED